LIRSLSIYDYLSIGRVSLDTQSEKACDHNDHDHYADDVENIHCFAPIETLACSAAQAAGDKTRSVLSAGAPGLCGPTHVVTGKT
jgi:hypothetical protein